MTVVTAHKILIGTAILFAAGPVVGYGAVRFAREGGTQNLGLALGGAVATVALALYFRAFVRRNRPQA